MSLFKKMVLVNKASYDNLIQDRDQAKTILHALSAHRQSFLKARDIGIFLLDYVSVRRGIPGHFVQL